MIHLDESRTVRNLAELFARDAQALVCFRRFARTARQEGFPKIASLFERLAQSQEILVDGHLDFLREVGDPITGLPLGSTQENLRAALNTELEDARDLYPSAARTAASEGFAALASWFNTLAASRDADIRRIESALSGLGVTDCT